MLKYVILMRKEKFEICHFNVGRGKKKRMSLKSWPREQISKWEITLVL